MDISPFHVLADPTRMRLIEALLQGERAVGELVAQVDVQQSGVSRHLRILQEAGFVRVRPDGQRRLYALRPEPFLELNDWSERFRTLWEARLDRLGVELERRKRARASRSKGQGT
jgi:DNA-binding transcriptional ArsR family regulator